MKSMMLITGLRRRGPRRGPSMREGQVGGEQMSKCLYRAQGRVSAWKTEGTVPG